MAEANRYEFTHKEVAAALVRQQGVKKGIWALTFKFGIIGGLTGPRSEEATPTAMVQIASIGIEKVDYESHLSVDAAKVNPSRGAHGLLNYVDESKRR
jgi:hypothetical protein